MPEEKGRHPPAFALVEFEDQPRLADAGVADDAHDLPSAVGGERQAALQQVQLLASTHELRQPPAQAEAGPLQADQHVGARLVGRAGAGRQLETSHEQRGGRVRHQDAAQRRALHQLVEHRPDIAPLVHVELGRPRTRTDADQHDADVNADLDRGFGSVLALGALDRLEDRHGAVAGAIRRVADLRQAEDRHGTDRTEAFDPTPERPDLVEDELQRAPRLELCIRPTSRHERGPQQGDAPPLPAPSTGGRRHQ